MSQNVFGIERSSLAAGEIHKNVKLESWSFETTKNGNQAIKLIFVNDNQQEYVHFSFAHANEYRARELNTSLTQILGCYVPVSTVHAQTRAVAAKLDFDAMDEKESLQAFFEHVMVPILESDKANVKETPVDIKLIYAHHNNAARFPDALFNPHPFICRSGSGELKFSTEVYGPKHKTYAGLPKEPQEPNEIDDASAGHQGNPLAAGVAAPSTPASAPKVVHTPAPINADDVFAAQEAKEKKEAAAPKEGTVEEAVANTDRKAAFEKAAPVKEAPVGPPAGAPAISPMSAPDPEAEFEAAMHMNDAEDDEMPY